MMFILVVKILLTGIDIVHRVNFNNRRFKFLVHTLKIWRMGQILPTRDIILKRRAPATLAKF